MKNWAAAACLSAISLSLAGCGGGGSDAHAMEAVAPRVGQYNFLLEIAGLTPTATVVGISGIGGQSEIIEFAQGDSGVTKLPGRTSYGEITLKRGYLATDDLWKWRAEVVAGAFARRNGAVTVFQDGEPIARYEFFEAWPSKWSVSDLDSNTAATGNEVAIETITLAVDRVERVDPSARNR